MTLEEKTDNILREENPTAEATRTLLKVDKPQKDGTDIELKTDLSEDEVKIHSVLATLNQAIEMTPKEFSEKCILGTLINRKERKALSKLRKSRGEIVDIARPSDVNVSGESGVKEGFVNRFLKPRIKNNQ